MIRPWFEEEEPDLFATPWIKKESVVSAHGVLHNNPFDVSLPIAGWQGPGTIVGIPGQPGFASFPSMQDGWDAGIQRIVSYIEEGHNTIVKMGRYYAQDPHWPLAVSELSKIPEGEELSVDDKVQIAALAAGILKQERGLTVAQLGIDTGVEDA